MNRYDCELVRDGQKWRFKRVTIDNAWAQGNPEILNALAIQPRLGRKIEAVEIAQKSATEDCLHTSSRCKRININHQSYYE